MTACGACASEVQDDAKFCHQCGAPIAAQTPAEYKQVTVLFADVVRSMDIAAEVGPERLREIMSELVDLATKVVRRYGGTVDKFTGDGIMAVFGAPATLEDHAFRACLAALDIQAETKLELRIGLNSGQVITGEIGSAALGYTAIGAQVGMAQRMEAVAPPGAVMLSDSTARLVENTVALAAPELVFIKGADAPVSARRLLAVTEQRPQRRSESTLVGRSWELNTVTSLLDEAVSGAGCVVTFAGPAGIGKSRLVREASALASNRGVPVFTTYCESHTTDIPFRAVSRLLRAALGIEAFDAVTAGEQIRAQFSDADPDDVLLLEDLLGLRDATAMLPEVAAEARRRRLTSLINAASLARAEPAVYVIEDAHWIDEASESLLADFLSVVPQTPSLTLITHRPEYDGPLARLAGAQNLVLRPLTNTQASTLTVELLGSDPSVHELADLVCSRAGGNPFFSEEIVRDLTERGVIGGQPGSYRLQADIVDANVPATLQATIGARIDRLEPVAKTTLNAAAVIGARFEEDMLRLLVDGPDLQPLIEAQLIDRVAFGPRPEYAFRHPLIRAVASESQLKSDRAQRHRALASALEGRGLTDEYASLIAEHLEAASDLHAAYAWHMRAGGWSISRDITAARTSWSRACQVADRLPDDDPDRMSMRIAPRAMLLGTVWRVGSIEPDDRSYVELRELCAAAGDSVSLAAGMAGLVAAQSNTIRSEEASELGTELVRLLESIGDPAVTAALAGGAIGAKFETAELAEVLRLAEWIVASSGAEPGDADTFQIMPHGDVFASRGMARCYLGLPGWREDLEQGLSLARRVDPAKARTIDPFVVASVMYHARIHPIANGVMIPTVEILRETEEILALAEQFSEDLGLYLAKLARGVALVHCVSTEERAAGLEILSKVRDASFRERFAADDWPVVDAFIAREMAARGELDGAIRIARSVVDDYFTIGHIVWMPMCVGVLVEALVQRGDASDLADAQRAIERLAALPTDTGYVLNELWGLRLRTLLAKARADTEAFGELAGRYLRMATELDFEGHVAMARELARPLPTNQ
ncbi:adenylate/guanylate cyclase domain-containing protein [Mycobacterium sp. E740]|uniref:AAA family ATPase n=1 Tax=Mycobacterium sp. E740 TaxID=1834149 RepID=UPI0007FC6EEA|nr:adenylate/guanylate cyclase domain-containing protein [Mycobacterium sp. E740]OBI73021.1 cyclase [Mycobacterium sp. E740]